MSTPGPDIALAVLLLGALLMLREATLIRRDGRRRELMGHGLQALSPEEPEGSGGGTKPSLLLTESRRRLLEAAGVGVVGAVLGFRLVPPMGFALGAAAGIALPFVRARRDEARRAELLERQLSEVVEATALAVRSGLSIGQALDFAAGEVERPMSDVLAAALAKQRFGVPLEQALVGFGEAVDTDDARLFVLILHTQVRTGGNLAGALDEVNGTIRHRVGARRELRALTAQGRLSGAILGALPIAFFLVLSLTSRNELEPVYRSGAGIAMVSLGLMMQAGAYLWIRRLLQVQV